MSDTDHYDINEVMHIALQLAGEELADCPCPEFLMAIKEPLKVLMSARDDLSSKKARPKAGMLFPITGADEGRAALRLDVVKRSRP